MGAKLFAWIGGASRFSSAIAFFVKYSFRAQSNPAGAAELRLGSLSVPVLWFGRFCF